MPHRQITGRHRFTVFTGEEKNKVTEFIKKELDQLADKYGERSIGSLKKTCNAFTSSPVLIFVWNKGYNYSDPRIRES